MKRLSVILLLVALTMPLAAETSEPKTNPQSQCLNLCDSFALFYYLGCMTGSSNDTEYCTIMTGIMWCVCCQGCNQTNLCPVCGGTQITDEETAAVKKWLRRKMSLEDRKAFRGIEAVADRFRELLKDPEYKKWLDGRLKEMRDLVEGKGRR